MITKLLPASARSSFRLLPRTWTLVALAALVGSGIGVALAATHQSSSRLAVPPTPPNMRWAAGIRRAPDFRLRDQQGRSISLASLRGRATILTFIDPLCRNLCPLEAKVLDSAARRIPASQRPTIVAVSVNPWAETQADLRLDARKWRLSPQWRWALGRRAQLASVWRRYEIGVRVTTRIVAG